MHYTGWLYDPKAPDLKGEQFDSSAGRGTPFGFMVGARQASSRAGTRACIGMKEGGKRLLIIPPDNGLRRARRRAA